jgi:hypothetical protein
MHLNALLDNHGKVTFSKPLFLKQKQVKVEIIIPNDVIAPIMVSVIRQQLDKILGKYSHQRSAVSPRYNFHSYYGHL